MCGRRAGAWRTLCTCNVGCGALFWRQMRNNKHLHYASPLTAPQGIWSRRVECHPQSGWFTRYVLALEAELKKKMPFTSLLLLRIFSPSFPFAEATFMPYRCDCMADFETCLSEDLRVSPSPSKAGSLLHVCVLIQVPAGRSWLNVGHIAHCHDWMALQTAAKPHSDWLSWLPPRTFFKTSLGRRRRLGESVKGGIPLRVRRSLREKEQGGAKGGRSDRGDSWGEGMFQAGSSEDDVHGVWHCWHV